MKMSQKTKNICYKCVLKFSFAFITVYFVMINFVEKGKNPTLWNVHVKVLFSDEFI
jgi:hypothetical protein